LSHRQIHPLRQGTCTSVRQQRHAGEASLRMSAQHSVVGTLNLVCGSCWRHGILEDGKHTIMMGRQTDSGI
jgi:hypothetical protein